MRPLLDLVHAHADVLRERIEANTIATPDGCLLWIGTRNADGRGRIALGSRSTGGFYAVVPRVVWTLEHDAEPGNFLVIHGPCDRAACCAAGHLRLGTYTDNMVDMHSRGRAAIGVRHPHAKLTEDDVRLAASMLATHTDTEIARALGNVVSRRSIRCLRDGECWSHVTGIRKAA